MDKGEVILMKDGKVNIKTARIDSRVTPEMEEEFKRICQRQGLTQSEVVRSLVEEYVRRFEKIEVGE